MIVQVLPSIARFDAISQHVLRIDDELKKMGVESLIVADHIAPSLASRAVAASSFETFDSHQVLYHMSIASRLVEKVIDSTATVDMWYHNITPAHFFEEWEPYVSLELRIARHQLSQLAVRVDRGVAASQYSEREMKEQGVRHTQVMPVLFDPSEKLGTEPAHGLHAGTQILSVGRYAPHKRVEKLIQAFAMYRDLCDSSAHLHLVGSSASRWYKESLDQLVMKLKLTSSVTFHEGIDDSELSRLYYSSDVYLCMSEHEGFCVPLVEAQYCELPIVAINAAAIPETVGESGIILDPDCELVDVVSAIDLVVTNPDVSSKLRTGARQQRHRFDIDTEARKACDWLLESVSC